MMCLFADLSLCSHYRGVFRRLLASIHKSKQILLRGRTCIDCPRESSNVCALYRDSYSNPMAAILSRRCQPLVTHIVKVKKSDAPNR
jgi:hypothetical protein